MDNNIKQYEYLDYNELKSKDRLNKDKKYKYKGFPLLLIIQIVFCTVILTLFFLLKTISDPLFETINFWYKEKLSDSIIALPTEKYEGFIENIISNKDASQKSFKNEEPEAIESIKLVDNPIIETKNKNTTYNQAGNEMNLSVCISPPILKGNITSNFGSRSDPLSGKEKMHDGLDIGAEKGSDIFAVMPGIVENVSNSTSYGKYIFLDHGNYIKSLYAHCSEITVEKGQSVARGQTIAKIGSTGESTGDHLHLEIIINGVKYDPKPLLDGVYI